MAEFNPISFRSASIQALDHAIEARVLRTCAKAGVCCIGIQRGFGIARDFVLFQPTVTTLAVPLSDFDDPDKAIELIKAKLAESGFDGGAR